MGLKRTVNNTLENIKDAVHESGHRATADGEQTKRVVAGDDMTIGEKLKSFVNQSANEAQANIDKTKRDARSEGNR